MRVPRRRRRLSSRAPGRRAAAVRGASGRDRARGRSQRARERVRAVLRAFEVERRRGGVERRQSEELKGVEARGGEKHTQGEKVLNERRSRRGRGRMGTGVRRKEPGPHLARRAKTNRQPSRRRLSRPRSISRPCAACASRTPRRRASCPRVPSTDAAARASPRSRGILGTTPRRSVSPRAPLQSIVGVEFKGVRWS